MSILFPYTLTGTLGALQYPKTDAVGIPQGASPTQYLSSSDWNQACGALFETALAITSGTLFGFQRSSAAPTGSAGPNGNFADFLWLDSTGAVKIHKRDGTDSSIGALSSSYVAGLSPADSTLLLDRTRGGLLLKVDAPAFAEFPFQVLSGSTDLFHVDVSGTMTVAAQASFGNTVFGALG